MTLSGEPVSMRAASRPRASMSTPANTNTTSATPPTVSAVVRRRAQRLRQIYENGIRIMAGLSHRPQADDDRHAHDAVGRDGRGGEPGEERRPEPERHGERRDIDYWEEGRERLREPFHDREREQQPEHPSRERDHERFAEHEARELASREAERLQDRVLAGPLPNRHDDRVGEDEKDDPDDHDRDHLQRRDDRRGHLDEALLEFALTLGLRGGARVHELRIHRRRDAGQRVGRPDAQDVKPGVHRASGLPLAHLLVEVGVLDEQLGLIRRRVQTDVDPAHHTLHAYTYNILFIIVYYN